MDKFTQEPTYYPIPVGLGIVCPRETCSHGVGDFCFNPLATFYSNTNEKEEYHFLHPVRKTLARKLLVEYTAYYHKKDKELSEREYLVAKYYSLTNELIGIETGQRYPRDEYTFHGYTDTPEIDRSRGRYSSGYRPGQAPKIKDNYDPHAGIDFNF